MEFKLKKIRLKEQSKLNESNLCLYKTMTNYIQNSNLTGTEREEVLQQIMDLILQAQIDNKSINLIIGDDYEVFCKSIIAEYNNSRNNTYKILNHVQRYLIRMLLIILIMGVINGIYSHSLNISITVEQFILANGIALFIIPFSKTREKEGLFVPIHKNVNFKLNIDKKSGTPVIIGMASILFIISILGRMFGSQILSYNLSFYNNIIFILFILVILAIIEIYKRFFPTN